MERRLDATETAYHHPLYGMLDWDDSLVCIKGAKGTATWGSWTVLSSMTEWRSALVPKSLCGSSDFCIEPE